jgi:glycosyltransferase involved in cell wall biosynthesis
MVLIGNGFDTSHFRPSAKLRRATRRELGIEDDVCLIGFVARFHSDKDHANLIEAYSILLRSHPNVRCLLAGPDTDAGNAELAALAEHFGVAAQIIRLGATSTVHAVMNALDVYVSSSATEGFPNTIGEAMACGIPCVATDAGASSDIVGETGWIVPIRDSAALAEALSLAIASASDDAAWTRRKKAARKRILSEHSLGAMVNAYGEVWRTAVTSTAKSK